MGPLCVLAGVFLRVWAQQHIQRRLGLPGHLTTTGPYAHMRNPLYVGNTLIVLGAVVMSELAWLVPVTLLWCLGIFSIAACYEESRLVEKYGDVYREYARDVPRWLPRITGWRRPDISGHLLLPALRAEIASVMIVVPYLLKEVILS
ncbi:MAG: isoprenylcysteine carboxylmethyltransferase family protein [Kiritimatiellae bacterium]|nr:isoprenylcysteine carboxylmethyltransferase family protein [Kiritimatiellia bacterium]